MKETIADLHFVKEYAANIREKLLNTTDRINRTDLFMIERMEDLIQNIKSKCKEDYEKGICRTE